MFLQPALKHAQSCSISESFSRITSVLIGFAIWPFIPEMCIRDRSFCSEMCLRLIDQHDARPLRAVTQDHGEHLQHLQASASTAAKLQADAFTIPLFLIL